MIKTTRVLYHLSCVLCILCYLCLWTVVCVVFIICLVSCVPCVIYVSGPLWVWSLSFVLCLVYPVLSMSVDRCVCRLYHLSCVLCTLCYLCLWTVVCVVFIICLVSCVPCVIYVSGPLCVWSLSFALCLVYAVLSI
jgi:hypothetical protein